MHNLKGFNCKMQMHYNRPYLKRQREILQDFPLVHVDKSALISFDYNCKIQIWIAVNHGAQSFTLVNTVST